ncbi:MAG: lipoyl(octanoyl) transferase LipB [Desulfobacteraceae bacterium]|nr:lipoyl(octanoyl) transferase LipB [Desulfobacteraceae bacterium]
MRRALLLNLPLTAYTAVLELQRGSAAARKDGRLDRDLVILLEHPPVFTLGRRGGKENLLLPEEKLQERGIDIVPIERGGNITYHGPGQLVCYVIFDLRRAKLSVTELVSSLEKVMIKTAEHWNIQARGDKEHRGAWVSQRKLGSVGVTIRHGISFHGLALNATTSMEPFSWINPCGISGCTMTSLSKESGKAVDTELVRRQMLGHISDIFNLELEPIQIEHLKKITGQV